MKVMRWWREIFVGVVMIVVTKIIWLPRRGKSFQRQHDAFLRELAVALGSLPARERRRIDAARAASGLDPLPW